MEKNKVMQLLLPAVAGAALLGVILFIILGPNPAEKTSNAPAHSPQHVPTTPDSQKTTDFSTSKMAKELPSELEVGFQDIGGGLKIKDIEIGEGDPAPAGCTVTAHYTGWQTNGHRFDSSYIDKMGGGTPISFSLNEVVKGWTKGLPGMKPGGIRRLVIPADMGYGAGGGGRPGGTLIFEVKLISWR